MGADFSLWRDAPPGRLAERLGLLSGSPADALRVAALVALAVWVPYVLLAAAPSLASGDWDPLLLRPLTHLRWLVTLPAAFLSDVLVERNGRMALDYLRRAGIVAPDREPELRRAEAWAVAVASSGRTWAAMLVVAFALALPLASGVDSPADGWHALVAMPIFRTLVLAWVLRWFLWGCVVGRVAALGPRLVTTHPDGEGDRHRPEDVEAAGAVGAFGWSSLIAVYLAEQGVDGSTWARHLVLLVTWVVASVIFTMLPSVPLLPALLRARREALVRYATLFHGHGRAFEERWWPVGADPESLGTPDISSLADANTSWRTMRTMRPFPIDRLQLFGTVALVLLPFAPLALVVVPADELLGVISKVLL